ncbi:MAG: MFS transporter [Streptosporangiaceae bacterium]
MTRPPGRDRPRPAGPRRRIAAFRSLAVFRSLAGSRPLVRIVGAYALFVLSEYAVWIAMLVYAYARGGATLAGLIALAQLVPAALLAPVAAAVADRRSPVLLLTCGYLAQGAGMAATAAAMFAGAPLAAYGAAVVASTAVTTTRPAQAALIPSACGTPDQLTAANVVVSWTEAAATTAAGLLAGLAIWTGGPALVFAAGAGLAVSAAALTGTLRPGRLGPAGEQPEVLADLGAALRLAAREPRLRLMLGLLTADSVIVGALDLLFVILAVSVLGRAQAWAGYLNSVYGAGAVVAATVSAALVGRRLGLPVLGSALLLSLSLAALAAGAGLPGTLVLLVIAGASRAVLDVASRTLLQRSVPVQLIGRMFGLLEGLMMAGLAVGAVLVPGLTALGGSKLALLGVAAILPLAALAGGRSLLSLDAGAQVPVVQIALLRALPLFAELPAPAIEGLAGALVRRELPAGPRVRPRRRGWRDCPAPSDPEDRDRPHRRDRLRTGPRYVPGRRAGPRADAPAGRAAGPGPAHGRRDRNPAGRAGTYARAMRYADGPATEVSTLIAADIGTVWDFVTERCPRGATAVAGRGPGGGRGPGSGRTRPAHQPDRHRRHGQGPAAAVPGRGHQHAAGVVRPVRGHGPGGRPGPAARPGRRGQCGAAGRAGLTVPGGGIVPGSRMRNSTSGSVPASG